MSGNNQAFYRLNAAERELAGIRTEFEERKKKDIENCIAVYEKELTVMKLNGRISAKKHAQCQVLLRLNAEKIRAASRKKNPEEDPGEDSLSAALEQQYRMLGSELEDLSAELAKAEAELKELDACWREGYSGTESVLKRFEEQNQYVDNLRYEYEGRLSGYSGEEEETVRSADDTDEAKLSRLKTLAERSPFPEEAKSAWRLYLKMREKSGHA